MTKNKLTIRHTSLHKNVYKEDKNPIEVSKNVYKKDREKFVFYTNLNVNNFRGLKQDECNLRYSLQKNVVREHGKKERKYLGKIEIKNEKIKCIREIQKLTPNYHQSIVDEYKEFIKGYCNELNFLLLDEIQAATSYRLIVGLGNPSVMETAMTLHNTYGIPYIPGQALKGVMRSYFLQKYYDIEENKFDDIEFNNKKINSKHLYKNIFGDDFNGEDNKKGNVIFFDSFPVSEQITIEKDVMTPHYGKYYGDGENPTDLFNTNPISFYTIKNTKFSFMVALIEETIDVSKDKSIDTQELKSFIFKLIKETLEEHGVGAKTAVGYGYFNDFKMIKNKKIKKESCQNDIQVELDQINKISDGNKKYEAISNFYHDNDVNKLGKEQKSQLAKYMKECF